MAVICDKCKRELIKKSDYYFCPKCRLKYTNTTRLEKEINEELYLGKTKLDGKITLMYSVKYFNEIIIAMKDHKYSIPVKKIMEVNIQDTSQLIYQTKKGLFI